MKALAGFPGGHLKTRLNAKEPRPSVAIPDPPQEITRNGIAKRCWKRTAEQLYRLGVLTEIDGAALAGYCMSYARWQSAERELRLHGLTIEGIGGRKKNPAFAVATESLAQCRQFMVEFGMTPSSRTRIKAEPIKAKTEEEQLEEQFFGEAGGIVPLDPASLPVAVAS
jgi:P27 family predicted phage terminase small subunit